MKNRLSIIKRIIASTLVCIELSTSVVYAADVDSFAENFNNTAESVNTDVVANLTASSIVSVPSAELVEDNPSINIQSQTKDISNEQNSDTVPIAQTDTGLVYQTLTEKSGSAYITVKGNMPKGTYLRASKVYQLNYNRLEDKVNNSEKFEGTLGSLDQDLLKFDLEKAYEITLYNLDGSEYQPQMHNATVEVEIKDATLEELPVNADLYRIDEKTNEVTSLEIKEQTDDSIVFDTDHFTTYTVGTVTYDTSNLSVKKTKVKDGITWTLYTNGLLVATGDGHLYAGASSGGGILGYTMFYNYESAIKWVVLDCTFYKSSFSFFDSCFDGFDGHQYLDNLTEIITGPHFNFEYTTGSMNEMFIYCDRLKTLDLSTYNTVNITSMNNLFYDCTALTEVNMSGMNMSNVDSASSMFGGCTSLKRIIGPEVLSDTLNISLPYKSGCSWYIDDNHDLEADSAIKQTKLLAGHTFIRSDIAGFVAPLSQEELQKLQKYALKFSSDSAFTLSAIKRWDGKLEYSITNGVKWIEWDGSQLSGTATQPIYLRGVGNSKLTSTDSSDTNFVLTGANVSCEGNIENLLDYQTVINNGHPVMADFCFYGLFRNCEPLIKAPDLLAVDLTECCYCAMFASCHNLVEIQDRLPATTLADSCYRNMFYDCSSLTKAPELPATTLTEACYCAMFWKCSNLVDAPVLPAMTLAKQCYQSMFSECTSLVNAPILPAMKLADYCYQAMFQQCTSLVATPDLNATKLAEGCYKHMFSSCSNLVDIPSILPVVTLFPYCYQNMFNKCASITTAPELPATTLMQDCYRAMFFGCTSLTETPKLPATTLAGGCYRAMFEGCTSIVVCPQELPATTLFDSCYMRMFFGCSLLMDTPELPALILAPNCYNAMFNSCTSLKTIPELPATTLADYCYYAMFERCSSLKLSASATSDYSFAYRIPSIGTGTSEYTTSLSYMFSTTGGTFKGTPTINTTYYLPLPTSNQIHEAQKYSLKFSSDSDFNLSAESNLEGWRCSNWNGTIEYSIDNGVTWTEWDGSTLSGTVIQPIYLRGIGNTIITGEDYVWDEEDEDSEGVDVYYRLNFTGKYCTGNIENLLDYKTVKKGKHPEMSYLACYEGMFENCTTLTEAPELPATELASYCYVDMFRGCTSLEKAPELPATILEDDCYRGMFEGCTSLQQAPELPATTLADSCYAYMFGYCTLLTEAPELPATELAKSCYDSMFANCTALVQAPELPATTLAKGCYVGMFANCTALVQAPELPATTLADGCYGYLFRRNGMFAGCTALQQAPELPATTLAEYCYAYMFADCTSLEEAPALPATTLAEGCYEDMFAGCTSLTKAPELPATTLADWCYGFMFDGCTSLKLSKIKTDEYKYEYRIPIVGIVTNLPSYSLSAMFSNTGGTFKGTPDINTTYYVQYKTPEFIKSELANALKFSSDSAFSLSIVSRTMWGAVEKTTKTWDGTIEYSKDDGKTWTVWTGNKLYGTATQAIYLRGINNTKILNNVPQDVQMYTWNFTGKYCEGNIETLLNYETVKNGNHPIMASNCYCSMFRGCDFLEKAPNLPAIELTDGCYACMFENCTSLIETPELPATILAKSCYESMFFACESLTQAPELPALQLFDQCYKSMFQYCTSLTEAPDLFATTLADNCYQSMFYGCTALKFSEEKTTEYQYKYRIPSTWVGIDAVDTMAYMLEGTGGTFTGTPVINKTYYVPWPTRVQEPSYFITLPATLLLEVDNEDTTKFSSLYTIKAKTSGEGIDGKYIKVVPDNSCDLKNVEDETDTLPLVIKQLKTYFGNETTDRMEQVGSEDWSVIEGSVQTRATKQGLYKGTFEFTYGLVDSID